MKNSDLKIIGYSLLVLSIGLAIAWGGLAYYSTKKKTVDPSSPTPTVIQLPTK